MSAVEYTTAAIGSPKTAEELVAEQLDRGMLHAGTLIEQQKTYEIVEELGEGGMGRIYKAFDPTMDRYVALKVLKPDVPAMQKTRFHREAVIAANFSHPNLVRVLEVGRAGDLQWLAMEHLRGRDVGAVLSKRKPMPFRVLVDIFDQTLDALHYIHTRGIAHCDIKPENIFITRDTYDRRLVIVKLIDFGIARNIEGPLELQTHITGDPRYMAPEQAVMNGKIDHRADFYAMGISIFEAATCRHPFEEFMDQGPQAMLVKQAREEFPPPSRFMPANTPPELAAAMDALVARATIKTPDGRHDSALEMQAELRKMLALLDSG